MSDTSVTRPTAGNTDLAEQRDEAAEVDPRLAVEGGGVSGYLAGLRRRARSGDLGSLPVLLGLILIWAVFQSQNDRFLSAQNLSNLFVQMAAVGTISVGIVLVLLLGEIDLSVGSVSGLTASILAVLNISQGMAAAPAIVLALLAGTAIGIFHGLVITRFQVPSFVVTLAGLIAWQGLQLYVLGRQGTRNFPFNGTVAAFAQTYYDSPVFGYSLAAGITLVFAALLLLEERRRSAKRLPTRSVVDVGVRIVVVAAVSVGAVVLLLSYRGVPLALLIFLGFVVLFQWMITRTTYGRHILAVGGNAEAARRGGINVTAIRVSVFAIASTMAAMGGLLAASRLLAVNQASGSGDVLLNAIAAAVIGGTSLFGGRGSATSALLGILVIQSISNGMDLLNLATAVKLIITGAVLLAAVILDATARRGRARRGRA